MHSVWPSTEFQNLQITACTAGTLLIASYAGIDPDRFGPPEVLDVSQQLIAVSQDINQLVADAGKVVSSAPRADPGDSSLDRDEVPKERQPVTPTRAAAQAYCPIEDTAAPNLSGYNQSGLELNELVRSSAPAQSLPPGIGVMIDEAADMVGLDRSLMRAIAYIESSGNPKNVTGSYKGLFQLSASEFQKHGGGNIFDPRDNARAAAFKLTEEMLGFLEQYGRNPTPTEIYLTHQQGVGGLANHLTNPNGLAWQNMAATAEGQQKGEGWARTAIWGNVPSDLKWQFVSVDNLTSAQFIEVWRRRVEGQPHGQASAAIAESLPSGQILRSGIGCCSPPRACLVALVGAGGFAETTHGHACCGSQCGVNRRFRWRKPSLQSGSDKSVSARIAVDRPLLRLLAMCTGNSHRLK
jgi:Transglycosylase SLT domain